MMVGVATLSRSCACGCQPRAAPAPKVQPPELVSAVNKRTVPDDGLGVLLRDVVNRRCGCANDCGDAQSGRAHPSERSTLLLRALAAQASGETEQPTLQPGIEETEGSPDVEPVHLCATGEGPPDPECTGPACEQRPLLARGSSAGRSRRPAVGHAQRCLNEFSSSRGQGLAATSAPGAGFTEKVAQGREPLVVDCRFGPKTEAATLRFQSENDLASDGKIGPKSWAKLAAFAPGPRPRPRPPVVAEPGLEIVTSAPAPSSAQAPTSNFSAPATGGTSQLGTLLARARKRKASAPGASVTPRPGSVVAITHDAKMPTINFSARVTGVTPDPTPTTSFSWRASLSFNAATCPHGPARTTSHPAIVETSVGGGFTPAFSSVRGGRLDVSVTATVGKKPQIAKTSVTIAGTNPLAADLTAQLPHTTLVKMTCQENNQKQFRAKSHGGIGKCPGFSADGLGGVGLLQITRPRPTDDEIWDWRANAARGELVFNGKVAAARRYPARVQGSRRFGALVARFNRGRRRPLRITVPAFTTGDFNTNLRQLELDAIRGYNGYGGRDGLGHELHEFRISRDRRGRLVVANVNAAAGTAEAVWERVPVAARPSSGDPDYVNRVLGKSTAC
jgi:peptidoglycan hydrolase-like protein with peptidoglycan-binding domain